VTLAVTLRTLVLSLRDPFVIARSAAGAGRSVTTVIALLRDEDDGPDGPVGIGEGYPDAYYGETPETMAALAPRLLAALGPVTADLRGSLDDARAALEAADGLMAAAIGHHGALKCALDIALHDLVGKRLALPVSQLLGVTGEIPPTDFTLGIDTPAVVAERAVRAGSFPALKIKVGRAADLETLEAVRAVYRGPIRVDANTGWTLDDADALLPHLVRLGVELIEQPFPARRLDLLRELQARSPLPVVADESAVTISDLDALVGVVDGVNVKLAKCGGVGPARRMLERARSLGFRTFLGCMEETSVAIAASAVVAPLAEWVDLDGCLLLADDPVAGLELGPDKRWRLPSAPGLGLTPAPSIMA
jgi:L-alanine-DL-glutamate epimerase-like enolase superfamily enzyme